VAPHLELLPSVTEAVNLRTVRQTHGKTAAPGQVGGESNFERGPNVARHRTRKAGALLKGLGFDVVEMRFVRRGKTETETLSFEHVRAMPIPTLRAELARFPRK